MLSISLCGAVSVSISKGLNTGVVQTPASRLFTGPDLPADGAGKGALTCLLLVLQKGP